MKDHIMVPTAYLQDILNILKETLECLAECAGDDSETLEHLLKKYDQWIEVLKQYTLNQKN
jgi:hypothetical protein